MDPTVGVCPHCGSRIADIGLESSKSRLVAGLLGIFLGWLGIHRFYLGHKGVGITQILVTLITFGFGGIWGFIEGILILTGLKNIGAKEQLPVADKETEHAKILYHVTKDLPYKDKLPRWYLDFLRRYLEYFYKGRHRSVLALWRNLLQKWLARRTPAQRNLLLAIGFGIVAFSVYEIVTDFLETFNWITLAFNMAFAFPCLAIIAIFLHHTLAWQRFRELTANLTQTTVRLGEDVEVMVRLTPSRNFELERLVLRLVGNELVEGSRNRRSSSHDEVYVEHVAQQNQPLRAGLPYEFRARLKVPFDAMHTFYERPCIFSWRAEVEVRSRLFPDLREEFPIEVLPEQVSESDG